MRARLSCSQICASFATLSRAPNHWLSLDISSLLAGTKCDDRVIRVDWDEGFTEGRQFGRGETGGQRRDEYRPDYDQGRGGFNPRQALAAGNAEAASSASPRRGSGRSERSRSAGVVSPIVSYCDSFLRYVFLASGLLFFRIFKPELIV